MAVAAASAWARVLARWSGGRCGARPASARARSDSPLIAVAVARAWARTRGWSGGRCGASPSAPRARPDSSLIAAAVARAWASRSAGQVRGQGGQRRSAVVVAAVAVAVARAWPRQVLIRRQVRGQSGQRLGAGGLAADGGGGGQGLGQGLVRCLAAGAGPVPSAPERGRTRR